jgi:hypothetical protein
LPSREAVVDSRLRDQGLMKGYPRSFRSPHHKTDYLPNVE